jgi:hypothetical protein
MEEGTPSARIQITKGRGHGRGLVLGAGLAELGLVLGLVGL